MRKLSLTEWIEKTGHQNVMRIAGVTKGAVSHWRYKRNWPRAEAASRITAFSKNTVIVSATQKAGKK